MPISLQVVSYFLTFRPKRYFTRFFPFPALDSAFSPGSMLNQGWVRGLSCIPTPTQRPKRSSQLTNNWMYLHAQAQAGEVTGWEKGDQESSQRRWEAGLCMSRVPSLHQAPLSPQGFTCKHTFKDKVKNSKMAKPERWSPRAGTCWAQTLCMPVFWFSLNFAIFS